MAKYLSKRAFEQIEALAKVAADERSRYRIDEVRFEPDESGMIGVATDGVLMVAAMIDEADAPQLVESDVGSFPDWRGVLIDADRWSELSESSRRALIDHELEHVVVRKGDDGAILTDDDLRPKLRLKPDDWVLTGFRCIVDRHGDSALEAMALHTLWDMHGQGLFSWAKDAPKNNQSKRTRAA